MVVIDGGITAPKGFRATGDHIGVRKVKKDIALAASDAPCVAAGCFTQNNVKGAHILWDKAIVQAGTKVRGVVAISGNANACAGKQGVEDNELMAATFANELGVKKEEILTAATGIIGLKMPMDVITKGIKKTAPLLSYGREGAKKAATGIMTTDTFIKEAAVELNIGGKKVTIGAMAKGSGMIRPNMATVLSFITTDINITQRLLQKALNYSVLDTYNMISVDGATSTNDMAVAIANGMAENPIIDEENEFFYEFRNALYFINEKFAKDIARDGEGASKFIEARVFGAKTRDDARALAKSIVTDNLVKTAMYGEDANWGRVIAAMGASGASFNADDIDMSFQSAKGVVDTMKKGRPAEFDENAALEILGEREIGINITLRDGRESATAWGCDLNHEYIRINGEYRFRS